MTVPQSRDGEVRAETREGVLVVTLDRPEQHNTFTVASETRYGDILEQADDDPDVRVVLLRAEGRSFCAGADMADLARLVREAQEAGTVDLDPYPRRRDFPLALRKPLVAAVQGPAAGLGMVHALYADVRIGGPRAAFVTAFAHRGLAAEYGISWLLPRLVGYSRGLDLLLSSRKVGAQEAYRIGLLDQLVEEDELFDTAWTYARQLATSCSPASLADIKRQVALDAERSFAESYDAADALMRDRMGTHDFGEGVASFVERREPRFAPLPPRDREVGA